MEEVSEKPGVVWAMDFVSDSVAHRRNLKILTIIDPVSNKYPLIHPAFSINGKEVANQLEIAKEEHGKPEYIQCDNRPEFRSKELDLWCYENGIKLVFSRPGKPTDNCHIESFNGTFRNECLNSHYFTNLKDAKEKILDWWEEYNVERPQKRLKE